MGDVEDFQGYSPFSTLFPQKGNRIWTHYYHFCFEKLPEIKCALETKFLKCLRPISGRKKSLYKLRATGTIIFLVRLSTWDSQHH